MASLTSITTSRTAGLDLGNRVVRCLLLVCLCFTLTSEGYISWLYHLMDLASSAEVDWHVLVGNYSFQTLGTALACLAMRSHVQIMGPRPFVGAIVAHFVCAAAASCASTRAATLAFGYLMAIPCGLVQAYYLTSLYLSVDKRWRGTVFGTGYACSIVLSLLLPGLKICGSHLELSNLGFGLLGLLLVAGLHGLSNLCGKCLTLSKIVIQLCLCLLSVIIQLYGLGNSLLGILEMLLLKTCYNEIGLFCDLFECQHRFLIFK